MLYGSTGDNLHHPFFHLAGIFGHLQGFETREEAEAALKGYGVPGHIVPLVLRPADGSFPPGWPA